MIENAHKHLERAPPEAPRLQIMIDACREVGPALFFSLLIITVSFLPVFTLESQEGRMFTPLAYTKTFSMAGAALLSITLVPVLMFLFIRGKIMPEKKNPINRFLIWIYRPVIAWVMRWKKLTIAAALLALGVSVYPAMQLGTEFMPVLNEGSLLFMPATLPSLSITKSAELLQTQDKILKRFPEVESVFGKAGRAATATDPAPTEMAETVINLKPEAEWRPGMTIDKLIAEMDRAVQIPGVSNAWTMPIKARIDMLTTGVRTPLGIKILGSDLGKIQEIGENIEMALKGIPGTTSVFAERTTGGYFLDFDLKRDQLARYGLTVDDAQNVLMSAVGGEKVTTTVEGRERYPVNVRYLRDYRSDIGALQRVLLSTPSGAQIPLGQVADIQMRSGPGMIRDENGRVSGYVYVDVSGRDIGGYVEDAKKAVTQNVKIPAGYQLVWSGQYEFMQRVRERLRIVIPITLFIVFLLLYLNTGSIVKTFIILLAVPFSAIGAIWLLYLLGYNMSIAVWVGLIALLGVDAETAVFMLLYLDIAYHDAQKKGQMRSWDDLREAIVQGAVKRLRPKIMTVACMLFALLPILWSVGSGADVMKRIAAPLVGGILVSFLMELVVYPPIFAIWKWNFEVKPGLNAHSALPSGEANA